MDFVNSKCGSTAETDTDSQAVCDSMLEFQRQWGEPWRQLDSNDPEIIKIRKFLSITHSHRTGGFINIFRKPGETSYFFPASPEGYTDAARYAYSHRHEVNVYHSVGRLKHKLRYGRGRKEDIGWIDSISADLDYQAAQHKSTNLPTRDEAIAALAKMPVAPSLLIESGGGFQPYWLLAEPIEIRTEADIDRVEKIVAAWQDRLRQHLNGKHLDPTPDIARLLRVVDTTNINCQKPTRVELLWPKRLGEPVDRYPGLQPFLDILPKKASSGTAGAARPTSAANTASAEGPSHRYRLPVFDPDDEPHVKFEKAMEAGNWPLQWTGERTFVAFCPVHGDKRHGHLYGTVDADDGRLLLFCHHSGCSKEEIVKALGMQMSDLFRKSRGRGGTVVRQVRLEIEDAQHLARMGRLSNLFRDAITADQLDRLSKDLGLSVQALRAVDCGWCQEWSAYSFPMRTASGQVCGIRLRDPADGGKFAYPGSRQGLFDARCQPVEDRPTLIVEGASDAAAAFDLGFPAVGRPSCSSGVELLVRRYRSLAEPGTAVVMPDNDTAGIQGARNLVTVLVAATNLSVKVLPPPEGIKDLRNWLRSGLTAEELIERVSREPCVQISLRGGL